MHFLLWTKESHQNPINFDTFKCSGENLPNFSCHFPNNKSVFLQILPHFLVSWKITFPPTFEWAGQIWPNSNSPNSLDFVSLFNVMRTNMRQQIWWNFTGAVESLKFCTLIGSFCSNHVQFQLKTYRRVISHDTEAWCKVQRKTDLQFQKWDNQFGEFSSNHSKVWQFHFDGFSLSKV